jgi:prepilin-type N-terminal cleavage/methylation domain-containing protein
MKKFSGFTLVEFIIVLAMIGVLCIIAVPVYKSRAVKNKALKIDAYEGSQTLETFSENNVQNRAQEKKFKIGLK